MGIGDWFKTTFSKQACAFCGAEVGMMHRDKIKNKEFICDDCRHTCSRFIQVYRYTKEELQQHMAYIKGQDRLYNEVLGSPSRVVPTATNKQSIEFYDHAGMFRIRDRNYDDKYLKELIRYDQVASYEPYCDEAEPDEPGKEKLFGECGVKLTLVTPLDDLQKLPKGLRPHPYITQELTVCVNDRDKHIGMLDVQHIIGHFDYIFGVHSDRKGLFSFGPTKQQQRQGDAFQAMGGLFKAAVSAAKTGQVSDETKAQFEDAMNKVDDAATMGLAQYSRLADEAEAKIQEEA